MKKVIATMLSVLILAACVGCTHYVPDKNKGNTVPGDDERDKPFVVRLTYEGQPYKPRFTMSAYWTDKYTGRSVSAEFDADGVASITGLDGEYSVSVAPLPSDYTYNPNIYETDNDRREVSVRLLKVMELTGKGTDFYGNVIQFTEETLQDTAYRLRFDQAGQKYYARFRPTRTGKFVIQSIADIHTDEVNPRLEYYAGTVGLMPKDPTKVIDYDENDPESTKGIYTKNFLFRMELREGYVGNVFGFVIKCDNRGKWPAYVDFTLTRYDAADEIVKEYDLVLPEEEFTDESGARRAPTPGVGSFRPLGGASSYTDKNGNTRYRFDASLVWYADPARTYDVLGGNGDGYYHMMRDGAPVADCVYALFTRAALPGVFASFYNANLQIGDKDYTFFIRGYRGLVEAGHPQAEDFAERKSYADWLDTYGCYPVTAELRDFLCEFAASRHYFFDGQGSAELLGYDAAEGETWMFACGYYR